MVAVVSLIPYARNARTHSDEQVAKIAGITLIACEKSGRRARLIELDTKYVDVIVKRWQDFTGKEAQRASDGASFNVLSDASAFKSEPAPTL